jgi:hypothetical protein
LIDRLVGVELAGAAGLAAFGDRFGGSALSESVSKSACAFPTRSSAALVVASSASALSARARNSSISRSRRSFAAGASPDRAPASTALRHSTMWEEYKPSWRKITPPVTTVRGLVLGQDPRLCTRR